MADIRNRELKLADCRFDWVFHGYDSVFDNGVTFSDIDGVVHHNGHFLFVEHKSMSRTDDPPRLSRGQSGLYHALAELDGATCIVVGGDMQKSVPYYIQIIGSGVTIDLRSEDEIFARTVLRNILQGWYKTAIKKPKDENESD